MRGSRSDAFFISFQEAIEDIGYGEDEADDGAKDWAKSDHFAFWVEDWCVLRCVSGNSWEGEFGEDKDVDDGEENKGQVLQADHAAG